MDAMKHRSLQDCYLAASLPVVFTLHIARGSMAAYAYANGTRGLVCAFDDIFARLGWVAWLSHTLPMHAAAAIVEEPLQISMTIMAVLWFLMLDWRTWVWTAIGLRHWFLRSCIATVVKAAVLCYIGSLILLGQ